MDYSHLKQQGPYWMETAYFYFTYNFREMYVGQFIRTILLGITGLERQFYLKVKRASWDLVTFEVGSVDMSRRDDDEYCLSITFTLVGSPSNTKWRSIHCDSSVTSVAFEMHEIPNRSRNFLKITFWMHEFINLEAAPCQQEEVLQARVKTLSPSLEKYRDMAYLLGRYTFESILSGRQNEKYAAGKTDLIMNSFRFAGVLADRKRRFIHEQNCLSDHPKSETDMGSILGYIFSEEERNITHGECCSLYMYAARFGLENLMRECSDFILDNINKFDVESLIQALIVAELVDNNVLQEQLVGHFTKKREEILQSEMWINFRLKCPGSAENIINTYEGRTFV